MCRVDGTNNADAGVGNVADTQAEFAALLEDSAEELYESAPCGYLSTLMNGTVAKINTTLLDWLGLEHADVVGRMRFSDLLTVGGKLYHETHFAPLLRMQGEVHGIALDLKRADRDPLPVLVSSAVKRGIQGEPLLIRTTVVNAADRRAYEAELLHRRQEAEQAQAEADRARRQAESDRERLADALAVLQRSLVPSVLPDVPGMERAVYYHTASPDRLGGDFYDLFPLTDGLWGFFIGDVCGKGPAAASLTSLTRYTLRAAALHDPDPAVALTTLNSVLHENYSASGDPRYCTAIFGVLEPVPSHPGQRRVRIASGGHPSALVLRADGRTEFLTTTGGMLIGILPDAQFTAAQTTLAPGDTVLLYTDGLTEARTGPTRKGLFGDDALRAFAAAHAPTTPAELIGTLTRLLQGFGEGLDDDTALLALGIPASSPAVGPATNPSR